MYSFRASSVNAALAGGLRYLLSEGVEEDSRNGKVLVAPGPVMTEYTNPRRRVLFSPTRDANPYFHFFESLWMLNGDNDIELPCYFNSKYGQYSDDGKTMWDSYGWRWKSFFGWDQVEAIAAELKTNPGSRRCVMSLWNGMPLEDFGLQYRPDFYVATHGGKAVPCNTHVYFDCRGGVLNMTVCNRSNDAVWGCYGANAVHFSFLQEYMAMKVGVSLGIYRQFSNNLHVYLDKLNRDKMQHIIWDSLTEDPSHPDPVPLIYPELGPAIEAGFDKDLPEFMTWGRAVISGSSLAHIPIPGSSNTLLTVPEMRTDMMQDVAVPMFLAYAYRKMGDKHGSYCCIDGIEAPDWHKACREWAERRDVDVK